MPVTVDKILGDVLLHDHSEFLPLSGGVMTGELDMQTNAIILQASDSSRWRLTVGTDGALITEQIITSGVGTPFGLLLTITNAA